MTIKVAKGLRVVSEDITSLFNIFLKKVMSFSVCDRNIQELALEMYRVTKDLGPTAISSLFLQCSNIRYTRLQSDFLVPQVYTVYFGQNSIR